MLTRLREKGLTVNEDKCQFRLLKLTFFGHKLSAQKVAPSEEKIAAVVNARLPQNVSEVRSFVQFVQYLAKFIPDFPQIAELLHRMLRKGWSFVWESEQQEAFDKLKMMMTTVEALAYFRNDCKTRIVADAGPEGIGAVLLQMQGDQWRAVLYASQNLSDVEQRYAQTEEALALVWACERFNLYVYGREFKLETDHKPLKCIFGKTFKTLARIEKVGPATSVSQLQGCLPARKGKHSQRAVEDEPVESKRRHYSICCLGSNTRCLDHQRNREGIRNRCRVTKCLTLY